MKWHESFKIVSNDIDCYGNVRPSAMLRYCNEAANMQMYSLHPSNEELRAAGKVFVLSRVAFDNPIPLRQYDELDVTTWPTESRLSSFNRCCEISVGGKTAALIETSWALVDIASHSLLRVTEEFDSYGHDEAVKLEMPLRFRIPKDAELEEITRHTVTYHESDINRHMNNTVYADLFAGLCLQEGKRIVGMSISYLNEAPMGSVLNIFGTEKGGIRYFSAVNAEGTVTTEAAINLTKTETVL